MSEQQPPAPQDTAAVAGPNEAPGAAQEQAPQEHNWQERYEHLQPEYTRTTQQLKELEQRQQWYELLVTSDDPDTRRQAAEVLGYQLPEEQDSFEEQEPAEYEDPYDQLRKELDELRQWRDQTTQSTQEEQQAQLIRAVTDERLQALEGVDPQDHDLILAYAINALPPVNEPGIPVPLPDVQAAAQFFQNREIERQKAWAKGKRAPYVPSGGVTANEVPDPGTGHNSRVNRAMRFYQDSTSDE